MKGTRTQQQREKTKGVMLRLGNREIRIIEGLSAKEQKTKSAIVRELINESYLQREKQSTLEARKEPIQELLEQISTRISEL